MTRADVTVERARIRGATPDSRAHLDAALARVSPAAIGVPPGALLLVRRLRMRERLGPGARGDAFVTDLHEMLRRRAAAAGRSGDGDLLFHDDADLAAAVIASWLTGAAAQDRGWWRIVTAGAEPPSWWRRVVLSNPRLLPRVVAALARAGLAQAWASRIDDAELGQATRMLASAHGVTFAPPLPEVSLPRHPSPPLSRTGQAAQAAVHTLIPEADTPTLTVAARAWLTLALVLDRRPGMIAAAGFPSALAAVAAGEPARMQPLPASPTRSPAAKRPTPAYPRALPITPSSKPHVAPLAAPASPPAAHAPAVEPAGPAEIAIETDYGGLFFILNALLAMNLYGDFTRPGVAKPGIAPFDLLALLGRRWFGARFASDPIHGLLATLGGRPLNEPAARGFAPPPWRVPDVWLAPWPQAKPTDGWHPAGFPLDHGAAPRTLPRRPAGRWIASLALYLEARLARALDARPRVAVRATCRHHARATLDGERLTVAFALADHPLALRLAGLDRDPGYISAARRDIAFVFA